MGSVSWFIIIHFFVVLPCMVHIISSTIYICELVHKLTRKLYAWTMEKENSTVDY